MKNGIKELIEDIDTHLKYQKMMGVEEMPKSACHCEPLPAGRQVAGRSNPPQEIASSPLRTPRNDNALDKIRVEIGDCKRCKLSKARKNIVFGVGNPHAELIFIGEGPGADEDDQGEPFVGRAGQLLTKIIGAMGLKRSDVYIGNIVKCRPPNNRAPEPDEIEACTPFLMKQIEAIKPKVIVCLGATAAKDILKTEVPISKLRGKFLDWNGYKLMPTFHPAFLLRNPNMKRPVWEDMQAVMKELNWS
ncbi:MAG: hypothetical protein COV46_03510 [Deltaproteobacteria bacterium CG11_big_fil_rev_8_21_14_0_20_49_13]|nr:MAG: hypothetical protein COV46_03510 [Deltaproteobacteria bacterium CG11_big_fil_rev_8_21_14_0_20_49_13]